MWNFQGSLFLALKFPRDLTQFLWNIQELSLDLFCLKFPGVTLTKKISEILLLHSGIIVVLSNNPHKKINQCLTNINRCLTDIGQF